MVLRLRGLLPYALPGALAIVGCWWYLTRKKNDPDTKSKGVSLTEVHTDVFKELVPTDRSCSGDLPKSCTSSVELSDDTTEVSQAIEVQASNDAYNFRQTGKSTEVEAFNLIPFAELHVVSATESNVQQCMDTYCDAKVFEQLAENEVVNTPSTHQNFHEEGNQIEAFTFRPPQTSTEVEAENILSAELNVKPFTGLSLQPCMDEIETVVKMSLLVHCPQPVINETESSARDHCMSQSSECNPEAQLVTSHTNEIFEQLAINIISKVIVAAKQEILASSTSNMAGTCQVLDDDDHGKNLLKDGLSQQFSLDKSETDSCVASDSNSTCTSNKSTQIQSRLEDLGNAEVYMEDSSVRVCTQIQSIHENLGNAEVMQDSSVGVCTQIIQSRHENLGNAEVTMEDSSASACTQLTPSRNVDIGNAEVNMEDSSVTVCVQLIESKHEDLGNAKVSIEDSSVGICTQIIQSRHENLGNAEVTVEDSSTSACAQIIQSRHENLGNAEVTVEDSSASACTQIIQSRHEDLGNAEVTMEDSSVSVCTSEDGISMDDPLQSTVLSSIGIGSYDSWSSSGIELTGDNVFNERLKTDRTVENGIGDVEKSTGDCKSEGPWNANGDAYHSGGSDVNSMDSVDSGCALGNKENEDKKDAFVVWEFEVPKHLVGRLIGKRGRFVNFLKESSGAKIYISTLPYTEDYQICHIEGSLQQVERSLYLIGSKFKELDLTNIYAPPLSVSLQSVLMTTWLMLPDGVTVEVIVVNVVNAGHMFVQQHTHPTFHALRSLDEQMSICYSQSGIPSLPTPVKVGIICVAPFGGNTWRRAQVVDYHSGSEEVEIRYVDYGGYEKVKIDTLRQIRSDFVPLPFQGAEVLLDNVVPLTGEEYFSKEADDSTKEMTKGKALLAQVTNYDGATGLPLVHIWNMMGDEVMSINRTLVEKGFAQWIESC